MLTNSGGILFQNMAAQNIDVNIISGFSTINEADLNSMLKGYLAPVNDEVQDEEDILKFDLEIFIDKVNEERCI